MLFCLKEAEMVGEVFNLDLGCYLFTQWEGAFRGNMELSECECVHALVSTGPSVLVVPSALVPKAAFTQCAPLCVFGDT